MTTTRYFCIQGGACTGCTSACAEPVAASPRSPSYSAADLAVALAELVEQTNDSAAPLIINDEDVQRLVTRGDFGSVHCYVTQVVWDQQHGAWRVHVR